jgi:hypothetical protein
VVLTSPVDRVVVLVHRSTMDRGQGVSPQHDLHRPRVIKRPRWPASMRAVASALEAGALGRGLADADLDRVVRP